MASTPSSTTLHSILLIEPCRPVPLNPNSVSVSLRPRISPTSKLSFKLRTNLRVRETHSAKRTQLNCSFNEIPSSSSQDEQGPPQEAILKAISEVSKTEGRVGHTTNVVIGGTVTYDSSNEWLTLDQKVLK